MAKATPLNKSHKELGARMVEFVGWEMPVQYEGVRQEHMRVREKVGLFDVSHMGELRVRGPKSLETLQWLTTNDVSKLVEGRAQYTLLTNFEGGIVDDIIVYCIQPNEDYLICVNASNIEKDFKWMCDNNKGADITNESDSWAQIAVQGPKALELGEIVLSQNISSLKPFGFLQGEFKGIEIVVARTGYTGEPGFEVFVKNEGAESLWNAFLEKGENLGVGAIGLGARDTLRTEMKYSLYGHEIDDTTDPYEAELGWVVKLKKGEFVGSDVICERKTNPSGRKLIGFKMTERGIPRQGYSLLDKSGEKIGTVTSGTMSPLLGEAIGIGYVEEACSAIGSEISVDIRGKSVGARVVKTPFVDL